MIFSMLYRTMLIKKIKKQHDKNDVLIHEFKNIVNTMKSPLISINFKKNKIFFNIAFINLIKQSFDDESDEIKYITGDKDINIEEEYFNNLYNNIAENYKNIFLEFKNNKNEREVLEEKNIDIK